MAAFVKFNQIGVGVLINIRMAVLVKLSQLMRNSKIKIYM